MSWLTIALGLLRKYWKPLAMIAAFAAYGAFCYQSGASSESMKCQAQRTADDLAEAEQDIADTQALLEAVKAVRAREQIANHKLAEAQAAAEKGVRDAKAKGDAVAAGLAADNLRLRSHWQGCQATGRVAGDAIRTALDDAARKLREEAAGRIIGIGAEADAREAYWQERERIRQELEQTP